MVVNGTLFDDKSGAIGLIWTSHIESYNSTDAKYELYIQLCLEWESLIAICAVNDNQR